MSDFLKSLVKTAKNEYASIAADGIIGGSTTFIDTGSYAFNALLSGSIYGGIPNKITILAGEEAVGKTYYCLEIAKNFLALDPDNQVIFFETEHAMTDDFLGSRGLDLTRFAVLPVRTVEDFRTQAMMILSEYRERKGEGKIIMFLDSLGNLSTNKEITDITTGNDKRDMTRAQLIKGAFRVLNLELGLTDVPLVCTNHVYDAIGAFIPTKVQSGGSGSKYSASSIVFLTRARLKNSTGVIGSIISCNMDKSRYTKPNTRVKTSLDFNKGLDRYYGLLPLAEEAKLFSKKGQTWTLADGTTSKEKPILNHPERFYTEEVLKQIDEFVQKKFKYGAEEIPTEEEIDE